MVISVRVTTKGVKETRDMLGRIRTKLPKAMDADARRIAQVYAQEMTQEVQLRNMIGTGNLLKSLSPNKIEKIKNGYVLKMMAYGHYVDKGTRTGFPSMRALERWGRAKGLSRRIVWRIQKSIIRKGIRRKNWISPALQRGNKRLTNEIQRGKTIKLIASKGKGI